MQTLGHSFSLNYVCMECFSDYITNMIIYRRQCKRNNIDYSSQVNKWTSMYLVFSSVIFHKWKIFFKKRNKIISTKDKQVYILNISFSNVFYFLSIVFWYINKELAVELQRNVNPFVWSQYLWCYIRISIQVEYIFYFSQ